MTDTEKWINESLKSLPHLCAEIRMLSEENDALRSSQEHTRWISVKEKLPEEGKIVMVHQIYSWERQEDGAAITIGRIKPRRVVGEAALWEFQYYRPDFRNWNCMDNDVICPGNEYITHWKPLPELPEEEEYGT